MCQVLAHENSVQVKLYAYNRGMECQLEFEWILNYVREQRNFDCAGYRPEMILRRIETRQQVTASPTLSAYQQVLQACPGEIDLLIDTLIINVSGFFRNPLTFEFLLETILPPLIAAKLRTPHPGLRVWSGGCAEGEEPYSMAILIDHLLKQQQATLEVDIFATDIDQGALRRAIKGVYSRESLANIRCGLLQEYFTPQNNEYAINPEIKDMVQFSAYDLRDRDSRVPSDSVFGDFDIVLCRNVLIYLNRQTQDQVFQKLFRALVPGGYLILGEAERPSPNQADSFDAVYHACHVYRKI